MRIPPENPARQVPAGDLPVRMKQGKGRADPPGLEKLSFEKLLAGAMTGEAGSQAGLSASPALSRDRLKFLVRVVQAKMNEALLKGAVTPGEEEALEGFPLRRIDLLVPGLQVEKGMPAPPPAAQEKAFHRPSRHDFEPLIKGASERYGVDPDLVRAVIRAESDFDPGCTSKKGAMGLMQLMPGTARDLSVKNPYNPVENVMAGTRYLKGLIGRYDGHLPTALAAYNWGMGNVERHPGGLPQETRAYIARVTRYYLNLA